jgi:hypothetical protein
MDSKFVAPATKPILSDAEECGPFWEAKPQRLDELWIFRPASYWSAGSSASERIQGAGAHRLAFGHPQSATLISAQRLTVQDHPIGALPPRRFENKTVFREPEKVMQIVLDALNTCTSQRP